MISSPLYVNCCRDLPTDENLLPIPSKKGPLLIKSLFLGVEGDAPMNVARRIIWNSGVIKEAAYSRIEIQGEIHFFLRGDISHKHSAEIYELIKSMPFVLKDSDYVPDISGT